MSLKKLYLFGYSGHALVVNDCVDKSEFELAGYFDLNPNTDNPLHLEYFGSESDAQVKDIVQEGYVFPSVGSNKLRKQLVDFFENEGLNQPVLKHESAVVSESANIHSSTMIGPRAVVNALASIGKGVIINTAALVEHECTLGDYSHIAPGAVLAGNVSIGQETFVGANSTIKEGVNIGRNSIIGAGSVVLENVGDNEMWAGVPAKKIKDIA